ncbi:MAG: HAMP domain-containing histidine kinase [bacterium]|nr:HAMP domain-containing histidine kinase [bacterium]
MNFKTSLLAFAVMVVAAALVFHLFERRLADAWFAFGSHPEVLRLLEESLDDQKELARLEPQREAVYRERFTTVATLVRRLRILEHNRGEIVRRYELILLAVFAAAVVLATAAGVLRHSRDNARLDRLRQALAELADGRTDIAVGERRRDTIGRIARMIERTSQRMARDRRRLNALRNLSAWQEAARRHAHEMRTPLAAAQLELTRLTTLLEAESLERRSDIGQAVGSAGQEIDRLSAFTRQFTSFARLPQPQKRRWDLSRLLEEFVTTFASAWPNLRLELAEANPRVEAAVDRDMLRQVLVNLCDNSSLALGDRRGRLELELASNAEGTFVEVSDDGPGIASEVRSRLFEPYTTTRTIGHGMGLGLAISKKIMLDHDGDLELRRTSEDGTTFRLTLPPCPEEIEA